MSPADLPFASPPAPGPHPATAELRAYAAGTLSPADEHRLEAHLLDCERCADVVEGFAMSDAATTDHAVAELRTRLQACLGAEAPAAGGRAWPRLAAAAALLAAVAGGVWTLKQHDDTPPTGATARLETPAPAAGEPMPAAAPEPTTAPPDAAGAPGMAPHSTFKPTKPADYAAVAPSRTRPGTAARAGSRTTGSADDFAAQADVAAPEAANSPAAAEEQKQAARSATAAAGYATADLAPTNQNEGLVPGQPATDTVAVPGEAVARRSLKAKAAAPGAAPALVASTPMPAVPAIGPAPVGGTPALKEYLRREASQFVPEINNLRISGTVHLRLLVGADGKLSDIKVTRGLRKDYDDEALRLVCEGPAWQPGIAGGKRAALPVELAVPF